MEVIFAEGKKVFVSGKKTGVGLGNFDGLHVGHMVLIDELVSMCRRIDIPSLVYTFIVHPENVLNSRKVIPVITPLDKKNELLNRTGLDYLCLAGFDKNFARISPEEFVRTILVDLFNVRFVVVGFDYSFGYLGVGTPETMAGFGKKYGFDVKIIPPVVMGGEIASSTEVRRMLVSGDVERACEMLGRPYSVDGVVKRGRNVGQTIGFPTANILPDEQVVIPGHGVYITRTVIEGCHYDSITNIGNTPTFTRRKVEIETHLIGFNGQIYGKRIEVFFYKKLRNERKFETSEELTVQIRRDMAEAENTLRQIHIL